MYDVRLFAKHKDKIYRVVQDDEGRIAYLPSRENEMRPSDMMGKIPDHSFMVGVAQQKEET